MTDEAPAANVVQALTRVVRDLPSIGKDQRASQQQGGYAYRGIEAITKEASVLFARHGVVIVPCGVERLEPRELTINGKPWTDERMNVAYRAYGPAGPQDYIEIGPIPAIGRDNSDKGANKCMTQAFKYALIQTLCIADAKDDADGTTHEADDVPQAPRLTPEERRERDAVQQANRDLTQRVSALDAETREGFVAWKNGQSFVFQPGVGYSPVDLDRMNEWLDEASGAGGAGDREASEGDGADPGGSSVAAGAGSTDAPCNPPVPASEPEARAEAEALAAAECSRCFSKRTTRVLVGGNVVCKNTEDCDRRAAELSEPM